MKIDKEAPIGVFDSGVGGLTVAREIMRNLPSEKSYILVIRRECLTEVNRKKLSSVFPADHSFSSAAAGKGDCGCM